MRWVAVLGAAVALAACSDGSGGEQADAAESRAATPVFAAHQPDVFSDDGAQPNAWADYDGDGDLDLAVDPSDYGDRSLKIRTGGR